MNEFLITKYAFVTKNDYDNVKGSGWPDFDTFQQHKIVPDWVYTELDSMLSRPNSFDHPTFCVMPWYNREITFNQDQSHCCLLKGPYDIQQIRSQMKQGIRPDSCEKCWTLEDNGQLSDRQLKNSTLSYYSNKHLQQIMDDANEEEVRMLKLTTSYVCNGACIYCNSGSSSYWNTIERRMDRSIPIKSYNYINLDRACSGVDLSKIHTLTLLGGEPLLDQNNFSFLQRFLDLGRDDVFVSMVTNASVRLNPRQIDILRQFKNLNLCLSIDGVGKLFEYQRWPLSWDTVQSNIDQYRNITTNLSVSCTVTNISVTYYNKAIDWFRSNDLPWLNNPVHRPNYFSAKNLPVKTKLQLQKTLDHAVFESLVGDPWQDPGPLWDVFLQQCHSQDRAKAINIKDYVPEFCDLVGI